MVRGKIIRFLFFVNKSVVLNVYIYVYRERVDSNGDKKIRGGSVSKLESWKVGKFGPTIQNFAEIGIRAISF